MASAFRVSAKDHSAVILMAALAEAYSQNEQFVSLQAVAEKMKLSQGYLEEIASFLKRAGLVEGRQGPRGGYRLVKPPTEISLKEILLAMDGSVAVVDCHESEALCPLSSSCSSRTLWRPVQDALEESLRLTTLANIV